MQTDHKQTKVLVSPCVISIYMDNVSESMLIHKVSGLYHFKDFTLSKGKLQCCRHRKQWKTSWKRHFTWRNCEEASWKKNPVKRKKYSQRDKTTRQNNPSSVMQKPILQTYDHRALKKKKREENMVNKWNNNSCYRGRTLMGTRKVGRQSSECVLCESCVQCSEEHIWTKNIKNNMRQKTLSDLYRSFVKISEEVHCNSKILLFCQSCSLQYLK